MTEHSRRVGTSSGGAATGPSWTVLSSHGHVLVYVAASPKATAREITGALGISQRRVITILHDLEEVGMVRSRRIGNRKAYKVVSTARFRHPALQHLAVGELVKLLRPRLVDVVSLRWRR